MNFLVMPVFFLSGALFPLEGLPKAIDIITRLNPLTYGVDGLRASLIGVSHYNIGMNFLIIGIVSFLLIAIGSYLFSKIEI